MNELVEYLRSAGWDERLVTAVSEQLCANERHAGPPPSATELRVAAVSNVSQLWIDASPDVADLTLSDMP